MHWKRWILGALWILAQVAAAAPSPRPNIIVIFTDDQDWGDVGALGVRRDVLTPELDRLAQDGVLCTRAYVTAPQCTPSRSSLMSGQYSARFGVEKNEDGPLPLSVTTIAQRLSQQGYVTGIYGKWILQMEWLGKDDPRKWKRLRPHYPDRFGFQEYFFGVARPIYETSHFPNGEPVPDPPKEVPLTKHRVEAVTDGVVEFIHRNRKKPFFLYIPYYAPHSPLDAPQEYLDLFGDSPVESRLQELALIASVDYSVGRIRRTLQELDLTQDTLFVFLSDNGGHYGHRHEIGLKGGGKGQLTEAGVRVPFIVSWPGQLPRGTTYHENISSLDVSATALAVAGLKIQPEWKLDGVNLIPYLKGEKKGPPHPHLFWRFGDVASVLTPRWKYLYSANFRILHDTTLPHWESRNVLNEYPDIASELERTLADWTAQLAHPGLPDAPLRPQVLAKYEEMLDPEIPGETWRSPQTDRTLRKFWRPDPFSTGAFLLLIAGVLGMFLWAVAQVAPGRLVVQTAAGLAVWLTITGLMPTLLQSHALPGLPLFFLGIAASSVAFALSPLGKKLATLPIWMLVAFQGFRLPLEGILFWWSLQESIPQTMTFHGQNFDIVTGIVALGLIPGVRRVPRLGWIPNLVGALLWINVIRVAVLSSPLPNIGWGLYRPLLLAFHFPYVWIASVCVAGALVGHLVLTRALLARKS